MSPADRLDTPAGGDEIASKSRLRAWLQVLKLSRSVETALRERMRVEFGSTLPRFDVLAALERSQTGLRMSELSRALMVSNGNVTGIVDRLADDELIVRVPVEGDRRAWIVQLTDKGRRHFNRMARVHEQWIDELLGGLAAGDAKTLDRIVSAARRGGEERV